ncbi:MAG: 50S ribosomal protein L15 [Candidatus Dadabacteria bacterium]|nr:MAG: 50S ribosomal protein L15 [Candidatus Dadabacteria bacterium]
MRLHDIRRPAGAVTKRKRKGRGEGSGLGKTAGRGQKGQKARNTVKRGFEGGQMPLQRRLPKVGFRNPFRKEYAYVNVRDLNRFEDGTEVTPALLLEQGLIKKLKDGVKILGKGELERRLVVVAHRVSKGAREKIEAAGGQVKEV